jgi:hypothetical protein
VDKGCNGYTCDINDAYKLRKNKQKKLVRPQDSSSRTLHRRTREIVIIDSQYVDKSEKVAGTKSMMYFVFCRHQTWLIRYL